MVNECIRIAFDEETNRPVTSMKALSLKAYHRLAAYDVAACYRLTAISAAAGMLRNHRKALRKNLNAKSPYLKRQVLVDCYSFKIDDDVLRLTVRAGEHVYIKLSRHTLQTLDNNTVRSVTLKDGLLSICYSKEIEEIPTRGFIGIDRNLDNVTTIDSKGSIERFDLSGTTRARELAMQTQRRFVRKDARIRRVVYSKYGEIQRRRVLWILHNVSAKIIEQAIRQKSAIVLENLKGVRKLYRKGNGQASSYRGKMNSWPFAELQRQIEYKARWEGLPVYIVDPRGTSAKCATCGSRAYPNADRTLFCPKCKATMDRDVNAARNILAKGALRFGADGSAGEAMVQEPRRKEVILKVDAEKLSDSGDGVARASHVQSS